MAVHPWVGHHLPTGSHFRVPHHPWWDHLHIPHRDHHPSRDHHILLGLLILVDRRHMALQLAPHTLHQDPRDHLDHHMLQVVHQEGPRGHLSQVTLTCVI